MRIAIVIHAFYEDLWPEIAGCVRNFGVLESDIFVTLPPDASKRFEETIAAAFPTADIRRLPNRGFDVGPFIEVLHRIDLDRYDFVVKLHTKRNRFGIVNYIPLFGGQWRRKLLAFCRTTNALQHCLKTFAADPSVGMIGNGDLIVRPCDEMVAYPPLHDPNDRRRFVGGTMFIVRAALLKPVLKGIAIDDFEPTHRTQTASLAHEWERRLGYLVSEQGFRVVGHKQPSWTLALLKSIFRTCYALYRNRRPVVTQSAPGPDSADAARGACR